MRICQIIAPFVLAVTTARAAPPDFAALEKIVAAEQCIGWSEPLQAFVCGDNDDEGGANGYNFLFTALDPKAKKPPLAIVDFMSEEVSLLDGLRRLAAKIAEMKLRPVQNGTFAGATCTVPGGAVKVGKGAGNFAWVATGAAPTAFRVKAPKRTECITWSLASCAVTTDGSHVQLGWDGSSDANNEDCVGDESDAVAVRLTGK